MLLEASPQASTSIILYGADNKPLQLSDKIDLPKSPFMGRIEPINLSERILLVGSNLLADLHEVQEVIVNADSRLVLASVFSASVSPESAAMRILGNVAEAALVRRCQDLKINRIWATIAQRGERRVRASDDYIPIGTALLTTSMKYPTKYQPNDGQRDIVWVSRSSPHVYLLALHQGKRTGNHAGLQIKVSSNGLQYITQILANSEFEVPLVYFDLEGDFEAVRDTVMTRVGRMPPEAAEKKARIIKSVQNMYRGSDIDSQMHEDLLHYRHILTRIIRNEICLADLVAHPDTKAAATILAAEDRPGTVVPVIN